MKSKLNSIVLAAALTSALIGASGSAMAQASSLRNGQALVPDIFVHPITRRDAESLIANQGGAKSWVSYFIGQRKCSSILPGYGVSLCATIQADGTIIFASPFDHTASTPIGNSVVNAGAEAVQPCISQFQRHFQAFVQPVFSNQAALIGRPDDWEFSYSQYTSHCSAESPGIS